MAGDEMHVDGFAGSVEEAWHPGSRLHAEVDHRKAERQRPRGKRVKGFYVQNAPLNAIQS